MDTKWKSIRKVISFVIFFLGVTLTLWNLSGMLRRMPDKLFSGAWEADYQQSRNFRQYISDRLENFLSIAINGCPTYWGYYNDCLTGEAAYLAEQVQSVDEIGEDQAAEERWYDEYGAWYGGYEEEEDPEERLTEEEKERLQKQKES